MMTAYTKFCSKDEYLDLKGTSSDEIANNSSRKLTECFLEEASILLQLSLF